MTFNLMKFIYNQIMKNLWWCKRNTFHFCIKFLHFGTVW